MQINLEKLEKNKVSLQIEVEKEKVSSAIKQSYHNLTKQVKISGFRPGKTPPKVLEKFIGKEAIRKNALEILIPQAYSDAVKEKELEVISIPEIKEIGQIEDDKPFTFKAEVEIKPEVELGEYKGIEIEKKKRTFEEKEVEKSLKFLQEFHAELVPSEGRPVKEGDIVIIDYEGKIGEKSFATKQEKSISLEIGKGQFPGDFEKEIIGMNKQDVKEIKIKLPDDFPDKELAGKEGNFKVILKEIKEKKLKEINDDFAKIFKCENLEKLKENIRENIKKEIEITEKNELEKSVISKVLENSKVEVPQILINNESRRILEKINKNYDDLNDDAKKALWKQAENTAKANLVLEAIGKKENIEAQEEEIAKKIVEMSEFMKQDKEKIKEFLIKEDRIYLLKEEIIKEKVISFLLKEAKIKEVE